MYRVYGTEMFSKLDAEFACVIYDGRTNEFIAARDPIGIRPLYYGTDKNGTVVFASEPKNLTGLCEHILPFPPGCYWKGGKFYRYCDIAAVSEVSDGVFDITINGDKNIFKTVFSSDISKFHIAGSCRIVRRKLFMEGL